jgi:hypothetical protein
MGQLRARRHPLFPLRGRQVMWQVKTFKTVEAQRAWVARNQHRVQWHEVFVNNAYGVEYRPLVEPRLPR